MQFIRADGSLVVGRQKGLPERGLRGKEMERAFFPPHVFMLKMMNRFYQGRLGTDIGKAQQRERFLAGRAPLAQLEAVAERQVRPCADAWLRAVVPTPVNISMTT